MKGIALFALAIVFLSAGPWQDAMAKPPETQAGEWSGTVRYERSANYSEQNEILTMNETVVAIIEMAKDKETTYGYQASAISGSYNFEYSHIDGDSCDYFKADFKGGGVVAKQPTGTPSYVPGKAWVLTSLEVNPDNQFILSITINILPPTEGFFLDNRCGPPQETQRYPIPQYWNPNEPGDLQWLDLRLGAVIRIVGTVVNDRIIGTKTFVPGEFLLKDGSTIVGTTLGASQIPAPVTVKYNFSRIKKNQGK